ncbi:hypothetical protein [Cupriavidus basilensis]|uniref:hypothetical protein n=1 Tax=Cupriavidus basilensis TaxID=68895 RepID=UPI001146ED17|nr:hypothetical protein [Cupriavidus basilensis]
MSSIIAGPFGSSARAETTSSRLRAQGRTAHSRPVATMPSICEHANREPECLAAYFYRPLGDPGFGQSATFTITLAGNIPPNA